MFVGLQCISCACRGRGYLVKRRCVVGGMCRGCT